MAPPMLWKAMAAAPRIMVTAPLAARAGYLAAHYADVVTDRAAFEAALARLPIHIGRKTLAEWRDLADAGDLETLAAGLIEAHYDPAYDRAGRKEGRAPPVASVTLKDLGSAALEAAADQIAAIAPGLAAWPGDL
jgi:tRNA 2-selenouridine synthase